MQIKKYIEHRLFPGVFFLVLFIMLLAHNHHISLWEQDEAAYAGFARRMIQTGDWLIPDYFWSFIHRKTPLHFWNIAVSFSVFGENNFALRLSSALCIWLLYWFFYRLGRSFTGEIEIRIALLVLVSSFLVNSLAKVAVTDGTLLFFSTMSALTLIRHINGSGTFFNTFVFWLSIALAALVKGPPVFIFIGFFAVLLFFFHPERMRLFKLQPWFFLPLAVLPLILWGKAAWDRDGGVFITWLLDWYVLKRINGSLFGQTAPPGAYFILISIAFLPFLYLQPAMWRTTVKEVLKKNTQYLTLLLWFVAAWFPFELSPSKLPAYTAAAHIPFALLLAKTLSADLFKTKAKTLLFRIQLLLQAILIAAIPVAGKILWLPGSFQLSTSICAIGLLFLVFGQFRKHGIDTGRLLFLNTGFILFVWFIVYGQIDSLKNSPEKVGNFMKGRYKQAIIANNHGHPPGLFVYAERNIGKVFLSNDPDSLKMQVSEARQTAFVLSGDQWKELKSTPGLHLDTVICGQLTDRKEKACYFIASRK